MERLTISQVKMGMYNYHNGLGPPVWGKDRQGIWHRIYRISKDGSRALPSDGDEEIVIIEYEIGFREDK